MDMNRISRTLAGVGTALYACSPFLDHDFDVQKAPEAPLTVSVTAVSSGSDVAADTMGDAYIDVRQQVGRVFALQVKTPPFPEFRL